MLSSSTGASVAQGSDVVVELRTLPPEAQHTHRLIVAGGPFPYAKDGCVFANRERLLPVKPKGFYREYTVPTPAAADRGARRIVCGERQPELPPTCFYSGNHYASFGRIVP
jgi:ribonuclease T1